MVFLIVFLILSALSLSKHRSQGFIVMLLGRDGTCRLAWNRQVGAAVVRLFGDIGCMSLVPTVVITGIREELVCIQEVCRICLQAKVVVIIEDRVG